MKTYTVTQLRSGRWAVVEKRYMVVVAKADSREEAVAMKAEIEKADAEKRASEKAKKAEIKKLTEDFKVELSNNAVQHGVTKSGKQYTLVGNNGMEKRSRYCYTLYIDGECVYTSGTLSKAVEYIVNN